ncbi:MAG: hypothetical protein FWC19_01260 [Treponema sp.]|nr:hypothetical protein [Treponema sp.]MCL2271420.1 hypothetical protein [Treponema sp.]
MIKEINPQKNSIETDKNVQKSKIPPPQTVKTSVSAALRSPASLAASAGLPSDKLSASIVSIARFFYLPLKPQLLADIRRQVLTAEQAGVKQTDAKQPASLISHNDVKNRQALALAACAAESKAAELPPKGFELYAETIDPGWQKRRDGEKRNDKNQNEHQNEENTASKTALVNPSLLKQIALDTAEKNPLLYVLNRLPGKDGQRWLVLPFNFLQDGKQFRVSIRLLLDERQAVDRNILMAVDVQINDIEQVKNKNINYEESQRQLFIFETVNGNHSRLTVCFKPDLMPKPELKIKSELSKLLGIPSERIFFKPLSDDFFCEAELEDFPALDQAV